MKLQTYKSLLTGKKTWLVASKGKCGYKDYVEYQIMLVQGHWQCYKTNGYELDVPRTGSPSGRHLVGAYPGSKSLKSVLNLVWGK